MSEQAVIDNLEFARRGAVLRGEVAVAALKRLQDLLFSNQGEIKYTLSGKTGAKGEPLLACSIEGRLVLQCQRCLEALEHEIRVVSLLKVEEGATQFDDLGDEIEGVDAIPASSEMNVLSLIEEEILLNLPMSPLHAPEVCRVRGTAKQTNEERTKPFDALAALKGKIVI